VNPSAPLKHPDPKFSQLGCSDDDDSEDDIPLSDLSRMTRDDRQVGLKRPRPPSPSVPNEEPILSRRRTASYFITTLIFVDAIQLRKSLSPKNLFNLNLLRQLPVRHQSKRTLFNLERVSRPKIYSTSTSSGSCRFVISQKGATCLLCGVVPEPLFPPGNGDSDCEESTEEAQIGVVFLFLSWGRLFFCFCFCFFNVCLVSSLESLFSVRLDNTATFLYDFGISWL